MHGRREVGLHDVVHAMLEHAVAAHVVDDARRRHHQAVAALFDRAAGCPWPGGRGRPRRRPRRRRLPRVHASRAHRRPAARSRRRGWAAASCRRTRPAASARSECRPPTRDSTATTARVPRQLSFEIVRPSLASNDQAANRGARPYLRRGRCCARSLQPAPQGRRHRAPPLSRRVRRAHPRLPRHDRSPSPSAMKSSSTRRGQQPHRGIRRTTRSERCRPICTCPTHRHHGR